MTILQVIDGRERDLGGFVVRRLLPFAGQPLVGPFIFFDHLGPARFAAGSGIDVRPHPHIGLATVTYLASGTLEHRDSLGNVQQIRPGDVNWMTAGAGIVHSERTAAGVRAAAHEIQGIQSWVALPDGQEDIPPSFAHHPRATLPRRAVGAAQVTVIAGHAFGGLSPVDVPWPTLYADIELPAGESLTIPVEHEERALYVVVGATLVGDTPVALGRMVVLAPLEVVVRALTHTRLILLGGARFPTPRLLDWNFVASTPDRIERARERWRDQSFPTVPGETEFIPLPP